MRGRLDQDTTGLLLLSDDGQFIHRMTSPKKGVARCIARPVPTGDAAMLDALRAGCCSTTSPRRLRR